jgi:hypothetical protein
MGLDLERDQDLTVRVVDGWPTVTLVLDRRFPPSPDRREAFNEQARPRAQVVDTDDGPVIEVDVPGAARVPTHAEAESVRAVLDWVASLPVDPGEEVPPPPSGLVTVSGVDEEDIVAGVELIAHAWFSDWKRSRF